MRKIIFFFIICISISAQSSETFTFKSENGKEVYLPNAGSSWYVVNVGDHKFKAKKAYVIDGEITAKLPKLGVVEEIDIFGNHPDSSVLWNASLFVENQQFSGFTMTQPIVAVNLRGQSRNIYLEDIDVGSMDYLNSILENNNTKFMYPFFDKPKVKEIVNEYVKLTNNVGNYLNGNLILDQLPFISQPDGPNAPATVEDTVGIYLGGYSNNNYSIYYWLTGINFKNEITLSVHSRLVDSLGTTLKYYSEELPNATKVFYFLNWSARGEFIEYWKKVNLTKKLPDVLTPVAGIIIRMSIMHIEWQNNAIIGSTGIVTRSNFFEYAFPIGQAISVFIGELN